jgi:ribonuclease R
MPTSLRQHLLDVVADASRSSRGRDRGISFAQLQRRLGQSSPERATLASLVDSLVTNGEIVRLARGRLVRPHAVGWVVGRVAMTRKGIGFIVPARGGDRKGDLLIPRRGLGTAVDGDRVAAQITGRQRGRPSGQIVEILERAHARVVGQYFHSARQATVVPKPKRLGRQIQVPALRRREARDGMWVVVEITEWTPSDEPLFGRVAEILGAEDERDTDLPVILATRGVDPAFSEEMLREVEAVPLGIPPEVIEKRRDLRGERIFTIDPETAKDFDDALSVQRIGEDRWRLGVHIADVAEHVRSATLLDAEARDRGTSIYPVDTVIPMLPERLSNLVCSLRPDEDSLAVSVSMVINTDGDLAEPPEFCESIIRSCRRLDYGQVQRFFDGEMSDGDSEAVAPVADDLREVRQVARALEGMRRRRGALDLDLPEIEVIIHEQTREVSDVVRRERWESHRLVEQCMLAANEAVAQHLLRKKIPAVYRDHDPPDPERLLEMLPVLRSLGMREKIPAERVEPKIYQRVFEKTRDHPAQRIIHRMLLRTLMLAKYDTENRGHFGLASWCYTHFTSPIRRYPDLIVHRILKDRLRGLPLPEGARREAWEEELAALARLSSERERRAEAVERDMVKLKTLQFLQPRLGEQMTGMIAGVAPHGFWVELDEVPAEGFVHVRTLPEDWYEYDEDLHVLHGEETGVTWRLGQRLCVRLATVDLVALELDLEVVERL